MYKAWLELTELPKDLDLDPRHPIQVVARRTGLSADVIRVWERRYGAVTPQRSATSRRLYSDADIARLQLLQQATRSGRRISDVAGLTEAELRNLIAADEKVVERVPARAATASTDLTALGYIEACKDAIREADPVALERALSRASVEYSVPDLFERIIIPLMQDVGHAWQEGSLRVSQEHMATAVVRSFLGNLVASSNMVASGPVLIVTTPRGQNHELGALMAAVVAASDGWNVVYLSPNMPANEIAAMVLKRQARVVVLGISYPADDPQLADELRALRNHLPTEVAIIVGGAACEGYTAALEEIDADTVSSFENFRTLLRRLRNT